MNILEKLAKKALNDTYLHKLVGRLEFLLAKKNILLQESNDEITTKEYSDLIRFADILSSSQSEDARNLAYKIVSLLFEYNNNLPTLEESFRAILIKLGNFPAITFLETKDNPQEYELPLEMKYEEAMKRSIQGVPHSEYIFTDSQYDIFNALISNKHFSFSGPTSLGKSFIIESFIKYLILEEGIRDNIAILVPTRALINQNLLKLKEEFSEIEQYEILSHPRIPQYIKKKGKKYIFVFTPERLISYISERSNPPIEYLFIDEAHKVIAEKDTRNPLYYHAILQAQKKSIRLYFASPNVSNPEVYLKLFDRSTEEFIYTTESPVSQNKYLLDLRKNELKVFGEFEAKSLTLNGNGTFFDWLVKLSRNDNKSIVYCNSRNMTREYALKLANRLPEKQSEPIEKLIEIIGTSIHDKYYLIDCLRKGVAFHFGDLPQRIRVQVENLFRDGEIDYLFCTSTLLEGVNLPAKNIFVLSDKVGLSDFRKVDFLNLIGRAGRLTKEFSGNIVIVRETDTNAWKKDDKIDELISSGSLPEAKSQVLKGNKNFYENIYRTIEGDKLTRESITDYEKEILDHYSNIVVIHTIEETASTLRTLLLKEKPQSADSIKKTTSSNKVPTDILRMSSSIKLSYQNNILDITKENLLVLSDSPDYTSIRQALGLLYEVYNWKNEEQGKKQILKNAKPEKHTNILNYYANLIANWMGSKPLKYLISKSIDYQHGKEFYDENSQYLGAFNKYDQSHVNIEINKLLSDIENLLRFRFVKYFNNYFLLTKHLLGEENAGANWADFLEYGSTKREIIELQNTGLPRHIATYIFEKHNNQITFDGNGNLIEVRSEELIGNLGAEDIEDEIREFYT